MGTVNTILGGVVMKNMLFKVVLVSLFCTISLYFRFNASQSQRVFLISIPKCGTHLLAEVIKELTGKDYVSVGTDINGYSISGSSVKIIKSKINNLNNTFLLGHTTYDPKLVKLLKKMGVATFFIYRDPRDHMVSYAFYVQRPSAPLFVHDWVKKNHLMRFLLHF